MKSVLRMITFLYIGGIFIFADSPMVRDLSRFNPYSLLHIPLYGILSLLIKFSLPSSHPILNLRPKSLVSSIQMSKKRFFYEAGGIALLVGVADEIYQSYLPNRNSSLMDLFLDFLGIVISLSLLRYFLKKEAD